MRLGIAPHLDGRNYRLRSRRILECEPRALTCPHGHRLKPQPYVLGPVGLPCTRRAHGGAFDCTGLAFYVPNRAGRVLSIEVNAGELRYIEEHGLTPYGAVLYLEVEQHPLVRACF